MSNYKKDILSSLIFLGLGVALLITIPFNVGQGTMSEVGPCAFPYFISTCMILLSVVLAGITIYNHKKAAVSEHAVKGGVDEYKDEVRALILMGIVLFYVLLFERLGYFISTFIVSTLIMLLFRTRKIKYYLIVYAAAIGIYLAFTRLLFVMLP